MDGFLRTLVDVALSNAVLATALVVVAALVNRFARRPALVHGLCLLAMLKLVTPPLISLPVLPAPRAATVAPLSEAQLLTLVLAEPGLAVPADAASGAVGPDWVALLGVASLVGSLAIGGLWFVRGRRFRRLVSVATPAPREVLARADRLATRVGLARTPAIRVVDGRVSPMICPLRGAPHLLLPRRLIDRLGDAEFDGLLLHELAHVQRRDHWVRLLESIVFALFWWFPVVWWNRRMLREAEEQCCDAWVVWAQPEGVRAYAEALLSTVDFLAESGVPTPQVACGASPVNDLKRRLVMIMDRSTPRSLGSRGRWTVLVLAACVLPALPTRAQDPGEKSSVREAKRELEELRRDMQGLRAMLDKMTQRIADRRDGDDDRDRQRAHDRKPGHDRDTEAEGHEGHDRKDLHEHVRRALTEAHSQLEQHGPDVQREIDRALEQVHEHLAQIDPHAHEHVARALQLAKEHAHEHAPNVREHLDRALAQVHQHLAKIDPETHEHVQRALTQARQLAQEHGPQVQEHVKRTLAQMHRHLGDVDKNVQEHVQRALAQVHEHLAQGETERALRDAHRALRDVSEGEEMDEDERRAVNRVRERMQRRSRPDEASPRDDRALRARIEELEQEIADMRAQLRARSKRER